MPRRKTPCDPYTSEQVLERLRQRMTQFPTMTACAKALGVSTAYLSDVLRGRRDIGPTIAAGLGLSREVLYRETDCT